MSVLNSSIQKRLLLSCAVVLMAFICFAAQAQAQTVTLPGTVYIPVTVTITVTETVTEAVIETIVFTETETITVTDTITEMFTVTETLTITVNEGTTETIVMTNTIVVTNTVFVTESVPVTTTLVITNGSTIQLDFSDAPIRYGLAAHIINDATEGLLLIGNTVDADPSTLVGAGSYAGSDNSDNGVELVGSIAQGQPFVVDVDVLNNTGEEATLVGYVDLNGDGMFTLDEEIRMTIPSNTEVQTVRLTFGNVVDPTSLFSRFRLTTEGDVGATGLAADGEVEDWLFSNPTSVQLNQLDALSATPLFLITLFVGMMAVSGTALFKK